MGDGVNKFKQGLYLEPQSSDLSNPAEGDVMFSDGTARAKGLWIYKDGAWVEAGSSGSGGINYLDGDNSDFENGVGDWVAYADAAATTPADGTGGAPTTTFAQSADTTLRGSNNGLLTKAAANDQGEGASCAFTIDEADQAKKLTISFDYTTSANYADDDIGVFIYDVTNTTLIRVNGEDLKANASSATHYAQFQAAPDSTSYRLILHISSTNASAYTVRIDNVKVGPTNLAFGTVVTDWESYTPTFGGLDATNTSAYYRRVGDSIELRGVFTTGTVTANPATISLPSGLTVSSVYDSNDIEIVGNAHQNALVQYSYTIVADTGTNNIGMSLDTYITTGDHTAIQNASSIIGNGVEVVWRASVQIEGWSSNAQISEDLGGRVVAARYTSNDGATVASAGTFIYEDIDYDTTNSYNTSTGEYTVPATGYYQINAYATHNDATVKNMQIKVNGTATQEASGNPGNQGVLLNCGLYLEKGDVVILINDSAGSFVKQAFAHYNTFSIQKIESSQTLLETETVAASYDSDSGQSFSNGTTVVFEDLLYDTHNMYNTSTGVLTIPVTGKYSLKVCTRFNAYAPAAGDYYGIRVTKNTSTDIYNLINWAETTGSYGRQMMGSVDIELVKGDTIEIKGLENSAASMSLNTSEESNFFTIHKIK